MKYIILLSKQGKVRLSKWYEPLTANEQYTIIRDLAALLPLRRHRMCNVVEYRDSKIVYRRYASLFFVVGIDSEENELAVLEAIHRYVELLDRTYTSVCELDIVFNAPLAYMLLDEFIVGGEVSEPAAKAVLDAVRGADAREEDERLSTQVR